MQKKQCESHSYHAAATHEAQSENDGQLVTVVDVVAMVVDGKVVTAVVARDVVVVVDDIILVVVMAVVGFVVFVVGSVVVVGTGQLSESNS